MSKTQDSPMKKHTVLVAEDNPINRELIREMLVAKGYNTLEAADGQEAFDLAKLHHPDLALIDIQMPVADGFQFLQMIREDVSLRCLPVLALTAFAMAGDREKAIDKGFDAYVTKPIDMTKLFSALERCQSSRVS
jgi:two-component system cell cycle response regulator DivK